MILCHKGALKKLWSWISKTPKVHPANLLMTGLYLTDIFLKIKNKAKPAIIYNKDDSSFVKAEIYLNMFIYNILLK